MLPVEEFRGKPPEFWAVVKLVSREIGYSIPAKRGTPSSPRAYSPEEVIAALHKRGLTPEGQGRLAEEVSAYSEVRADLMQHQVRGNLMDREEAKQLFDRLRAEIGPPERLLPSNKQKGAKRHPAYLTGLVNMLAWKALMGRFGEANFDSDPRGPLTFSRDGMPLRTLFRRMDGAYPTLNHPHAAWEIKEYYGTTTFGSRVADGVYESALDGYELNELREEGIEVEHYLFLDDRFTWWKCGKSYVCRIIDMLHAGLLDAAFFGREVEAEWPRTIEGWP